MWRQNSFQTAPTGLIAAVKRQQTRVRPNSTVLSAFVRHYHRDRVEVLWFMISTFSAPFACRMLCLALACSALFSTALLAQNPSAHDANELWRKAQSAQREKRWDDAASAFGALSTLYPENVDALVGLGFSLYKKGNPTRAEEQYLAALELNRNHPGALFGSGQIAVARQRWPDAIARFRQVIQIAPSFEPLSTRYNLALSLHAAGIYNNAVEAFRDTLSTAGAAASPELYRSALDSAFAAADFQQCVTWGEQATSVFPQNPWLWDGLAWAYQMTRRREESMDAFARAEKLAFPSPDPTHKTVLSLPFRGPWRVAQGNGAGRTHRGLIGRFAWDFEAVNEAARAGTTDGDGQDNAAYRSFGQKILAPADGRVVAFKDDSVDNEPHHRASSINSGNYILLEHAPGEWSILEHLQQGSVVVKLGQTVQRGQVIARCGNSGNTALPHLHFSLLGLTQGTRASRPAAFSNYLSQRAETIEAVKFGVPRTADIIQNKAELEPTERQEGEEQPG